MGLLSPKPTLDSYDPVTAAHMKQWGVSPYSWAVDSMMRDIGNGIKAGYYISKDGKPSVYYRKGDQYRHVALQPGQTAETAVPLASGDTRFKGGLGWRVDQGGPAGIGEFFSSMGSDFNDMVTDPAFLKTAAVLVGGPMVGSALAGPAAGTAGMAAPVTAGPGVTTYALGSAPAGSLVAGPITSGTAAGAAGTATGAGFLSSAGTTAAKAASGIGFGDLATLGTLGASALAGNKQKDVTTTTAPWGPQQPYLTDIFSRGQELYKTNPGGLNNNMLQGIRGLLTPDEGFLAGQQQLNDTLSGRYLNANPYLDQTFNRAASGVGNNIASRFAGSGRFGSGNMYRSLSDGMNNLANDLYGRNYQLERERQYNALSMAPIYADFMPNRMLQAGQIQQTAPWEQLGRYQGLITGNYGSQSTAPIYRNRGAGVLGGAMAGADLSTKLGSDNPLLWALGGAYMGGWG